MVDVPATAERSRYSRRRTACVVGLLLAAVAVIVAIWAWRRRHPMPPKAASTSPAAVAVTQPEPASGRPMTAANTPAPAGTAAAPTPAHTPPSPAVDREGLLVALIADAAAESSAATHEKIMAEIDEVLEKADAGKVLRALPPDAFDSLYGTKVLRHWVEQDRAAAAEWLAHAPRTDMAHAVALVDGWFTGDRASMASYIDRLAPGHWRQEVLKAATWEAIEAGALAEATAWAKQLNSDDDREGQLLPALQQLSAAEAKKAEKSGGTRSGSPPP